MNPALRRSRLSLGPGTLDRDMSAALVSMYLMFYLAEVLHISQSVTTVVTVVLVTMRVFDALNDPSTGAIADNTRSRFGRFKPWIALGAMLWRAVTLRIFVDLGISGAAFLVWFTVVYPVWSVAYTINDASFWGMLSALSQDLKERECTGVIARICANLGLSSVVVAAAPVTKVLGGLLGSEQLRWLAFATLLAVLMLGFQSLTLLLTRQQMTVAVSQIPFRELVQVIGRSDQLLWAVGAMLCFMGGYMTVMSLGIYYFKYVYCDEATYSVFAAILAVTQLAGLALFPPARKFLRRPQVRTLTTSLCLVGLVVFWFVGSSLTVVVVAGVLLFAGQVFIQPLMLMFVADCVEHGQWRLRRRNESVTLAVQPFIYKASNVIGSGFVGLASLVSGISGARVVEDTTTAGAAAFKSVMPLTPMVLIAASWLILRVGYRPDEKRYAETLAELEGGETSAWRSPLPRGEFISPTTLVLVSTHPNH